MATVKTFNAIDRIGQIADGFQKGLQNYTQGQDAQRQMSLQGEARRRQQALQGLDVEAKLAEATGRNFLGTGFGERFIQGLPPSEEEVNSLGFTRKSIRQQKELSKLEREEAEAAKPFNERDSFKEKEAIQKLKNQNKPIKLAPEAETTVRTLAKKTADAEYITGLLDSFLENAQNYSEDQLLTQGRQLIKTLNSTISSDATGAEEVKRLGSKLQFALGNVFNDNPIQFGRDLQGFKQQVKDTRDIMKGAMEKNRSEIAKISGDGNTPGPASSTRGPSAPGGSGEGPWIKYGKR